MCRLALRNAVVAHKISKPKRCSIGSGCSGKVQAHHDDYTKPLAVDWLCTKHHAERHKQKQTLKQIYEI
jgi:hypothetical protein